MTGGKGFEEAVLIARRTDRLSVGLHLTLCDGKSILPRPEIPALVDSGGHFEKSPARAWLKYSRAALLDQIDREIRAQFDLLEKTGIRITHVDSHHHLHMHPGLFSLVCRNASERGVRWIRIPREPLSLALTGGRGPASVVEWSVFGSLAAKHRKKAEIHGLRTADGIYGLSRTGRLNESHLIRVLDRVTRAGVHEIFSHPVSTTTAGRRELEALTSPAVRNRIVSAGIMLAGYRQLPEDTRGLNPGAEQAAERG
jgi:predicted glycoside hydrolase/deacetylase ChbG (UPF0249 family)